MYSCTSRKQEWGTCYASIEQMAQLQLKGMIKAKRTGICKKMIMEWSVSSVSGLNPFGIQTQAHHCCSVEPSVGPKMATQPPPHFFFSFLSSSFFFLLFPSSSSQFPPVHSLSNSIIIPFIFL